MHLAIGNIPASRLQAWHPLEIAVVETFAFAPTFAVVVTKAVAAVDP